MKTLPLALIALTLAGCNVYRPASPYVATDEKTVGRSCLLETAGLGSLFGVVGALATYPSDKSAMDGCMAEHGWVRK
jgi:hypothetical protein